MFRSTEQQNQAEEQIYNLEDKFKELSKVQSEKTKKGHKAKG